MRNQRGFTLAELMVAMTIGLIVVAGAGSAYLGTTRANRDQQGVAEQVENGRQALEFIAYDLRHAGFYGQLTSLPAVAPALPDPCETADLAALSDALAFPLQGYDSPSTSPISCLNNGDHVPGTDILVARRVHTSELVASDSPEQGAIYLQANTFDSELQFGNGSIVIGTTKQADGDIATLLNRSGTAAPIYRHLVHVYFVAPCAVPAGGGSNCTGSADDDGSPIPTLKRLELAAVGGVAQMTIVPLVVGIENLQVDYGIDDSPAGPDPITGLRGDGAPDCLDTDPGSAANAGFTAGCVAGNPGSVERWADVVEVQLNVLARNTKASGGQTDAKSYNLGLGVTGLAPGGPYKRHVYGTTARVTNLSARREIPL